MVHIHCDAAHLVFTAITEFKLP